MNFQKEIEYYLPGAHFIFDFIVFSMNTIISLYPYHYIHLIKFEIYEKKIIK